MNIKRVYISLPMAGQEDTIWDRYQDSISKVKQLEGYELCEIVSPIDITDFMPGKPKITDANGKFTYGYYLGKDIEILCECSDIYMSKNWENSKGCKIEKYVAETLGINILY